MYTKYKCNEGLSKEMLTSLSDRKRETLEKALTRNLYLTSCYILENGELTIYKEGFYLQLYGTRASFTVWFTDNDGDLIEGRKPNENKLHKLYSDFVKCDEGDLH